ncbi:hypothetical protein GCM10019016_018570 [Streptomyces prasinosporus]|uniref:Uncharacterized protein n=1 Tax=Streptomyces prasinosporus TaxID=68256 RepID=A0ABP6TJV2_9ACTN
MRSTAAMSGRPPSKRSSPLIPHIYRALLPPEPAPLRGGSTQPGGRCPRAGAGARPVDGRALSPAGDGSWFGSEDVCVRDMTV